MKNYFFILFLFFSSCYYPDIDTVHDIKDMDLSNEEVMDLCNIDNSDNEQILKCIKEFKQ